MISAAEILKMIADVDDIDVVDTTTLDEIDAHVWCWINKEELHSMSSGEPGTFYTTLQGTEDADDIIGGKGYTRSRDALKAIRPKGWTFAISEVFGPYIAWDVIGKKYNDFKQVKAEELSTEELAELHAIIQAIEYERSNS